eukprot:SAG31_NODE_4800_length_2952_cov_1.211707_1_plen_210_part_10
MAEKAAQAIIHRRVREAARPTSDSRQTAGSNTTASVPFDPRAADFWRWDRSSWGLDWAAAHGARREKCIDKKRADAVRTEHSDSDSEHSDSGRCPICLAVSTDGKMDLPLPCCGNQICFECAGRLQWGPFCRQRLPTASTVATTQSNLVYSEDDNVICDTRAKTGNCSCVPIIHPVSMNDTIVSLALRYRTTAQALKSANSLWDANEAST